LPSSGLSIVAGPAAGPVECVLLFIALLWLTNVA
jgi:hypothetical protein